MKTTDSILVGFDDTDGKDECVLVVGRKTAGEVVGIINAFQGEKAREIFRRPPYGKIGGKK